MQATTSQPSPRQTATEEGSNNGIETDTAATVPAGDSRGLPDQEVEQEVDDYADADDLADADADAAVCPRWSPGSKRPRLFLDSESEADVDTGGWCWRTSTLLELHRQRQTWIERGEVLPAVVADANVDADAHADGQAPYAGLVPYSGSDSDTPGDPAAGTVVDLTGDSEEKEKEGDAGPSRSSPAAQQDFEDPDDTVSYPSADSAGSDNELLSSRSERLLLGGALERTV
jgi:hypothetical protein